MPFPTTSVLDNFDRADGPLGANWTACFTINVDNIDTNRVATGGNSPGETVAQVYNATSTFLDSEVFVEVPVISATSGQVALYARGSGGPGFSSPNLYGARCAHISFTPTIEFVKYVSGAGEFVDQTQTLPGGIVAGDTIGFLVQGVGAGVTLEFWRKSSAGSWALAATIVDSDANRIVTPGLLGLGFPNTIPPVTTRVDNFGGGAPIVGTIPPITIPVQAGGMRW